MAVATHSRPITSLSIPAPPAMLRMIGIVRDSGEMDAQDLSTSPSPPKRLAVRKPMPYDEPSPNGECHFLGLPEEVMLVILLRLDLPELTRCFRLCKSINEFMTDSAAVNLRHTLLANSLWANPLATVANPAVPQQMPLNSAGMLAALRERLTRFRNLSPKATSKIDFEERSGTLYEYIEGVLLRTAGSGFRSRSRKLIVYDLRKSNDWQDEEGSDIETEDADEVLETTDEVTDDVRSDHTFKFEIAELAVDPGQDLLILVSLSRDTEGEPSWSMFIHLLSLSTFEPHPLAQDPMLQFPVALPDRNIHLDFQILDDMIHVMSKAMEEEHSNERIPDHIIGWQWTTGRLCVALKSKPTMSFQSFVMLTPWSYIVPTVVTRLNADTELNGDLDDLSDLYWTLQLQLYAFPPISSDPESEPHIATLVATIDLPRMTSGIAHGLGPLAMTIRTDPPPRLTFPAYPLHAPPPFLPDPESGIAIIDLAFHPWLPRRDIPSNTRFTVVMLKSTLARYLPAPTSPLLTKPWSRPVPVIPWDTIAPEARVFGPDCLEMPWVCYVYQNRFVRPIINRKRQGEDDHGVFDLIQFNLQVLDFDQTRVRQERCNRINRAGPETSDAEIEGEVDGITLVLAETTTRPVQPLTGEITSGSQLPYIAVEMEATDRCPMIDSERILIVRRRHVLHDDDDTESEGGLDVMEF